ncbi:hypothetical protein BH10PSE14_BH10PSE14_28760 [soil metagenome]
MDRQILVITILIIGGIFTVLSIFTRKPDRWTVYEFFLASRSLRPSLVTSLLVSGSFSLNGMLYQTYLGYKIGVWGLLPQVAWAISFLLLGKYASRLMASDGLHDFLGRAFSPATRRVAAFCSIAGLSLQIGWEYSVAKSAFASLTNPHLGDVATIVVVGTVFAFGTFYTLLGGLRSNSVTDLIQNLIKGACFVVIGCLAYLALRDGGGLQLVYILPTPNAAIIEFTISGLLANLAFSLVWQFVDMSTWQTAVATGKSGGDAAIKRALRSAAFWVFVAPGILGTFVGVALAGHSGLDPNTVLPALLTSTGGSGVILVLMAVALIATVLSFIDGMLLAIGYTVITDLVFRRKVVTHRLLEAPTEQMKADSSYQEAVAIVMSGSRVVLILAAIVGTLVLDFTARYLGLDLFQQVYIVTISQVALGGPVICGLLGRKGRSGAGPTAIGASLLAGFFMIAAGFGLPSPDLTNLAPVATILVSLGLSMALTTSRRSSSAPIAEAQR